VIDKAAVIARAAAWDKAHPPAGIEKVIRAVFAANLPNGTNVWVQIAAQFTGKEEAIDLVSGWDEKRLPYSQASRLSFGKSMDCSSFWYGLYTVVFGIDIGYYTEAQFTTLKGKDISWSQRRPADHVLFNFKQSQGRHASHAANIMGSGLLAQTTSPSNPFRFESDTYAASSRVGLYRVITDAQYQSLLVDDHVDTEPTTPPAPPEPTPQPAITIAKLPSLIYPAGQAVCVDGHTPCPLIKMVGKFQVDVASSGGIMVAPVHYAQWKVGVKMTGKWDAKSHAAAVAFQKKHGGFQNTGSVGLGTWLALIEAKP
jgi:cell wall-associated NlpC family hydrolase